MADLPPWRVVGMSRTPRSRVAGWSRGTFAAAAHSHRTAALRLACAVVPAAGRNSRPPSSRERSRLPVVATDARSGVCNRRRAGVHVQRRQSQGIPCRGGQQSAEGANNPPRRPTTGGGGHQPHMAATMVAAANSPPWRPLPDPGAAGAAGRDGPVDSLVGCRVDCAAPRRGMSHRGVRASVADRRFSRDRAAVALTPDGRRVHVRLSEPPSSVDVLGLLRLVALGLLELITGSRREPGGRRGSRR